MKAPSRWIAFLAATFGLLFAVSVATARKASAKPVPPTCQSVCTYDCFLSLRWLGDGSPRDDPDSPNGCSYGLCSSSCQQQVSMADLTPKLVAAIKEQDIGTLARIMRDHPTVHLNAARAMIQIDGCTPGTISAAIKLPTQLYGQLEHRTQELAALGE